ncbi:DUF4870 domain-containing protein [Methanobrevibacter sp.]|uniref:DUF4870 domain-containing protein n=1 Tax=Methanobrevibacter sp. TaxID=66852 RepID=UPI003D7EC84E
MDNEMIVSVIGYIVALILPIAGLVYGAILFYFKKDNPTYRKQGKLIIYFSILIFVVTLIVRLLMGGF